MTGAYENLRDFLKLLETNARITNVQEFSFEPPSQQQAQSNIATLTAKVEMYYQDQ